MTFTAAMLLDVVLLIVLIYFAVSGFRRGFILTLCSLLAVVLGLAGGWYLATHYGSAALELLGGDLAPVAAPLVTRVLLFLVGFVGAQLIWTILCHGLDLVAKLPVLHLLNKILGGALGLVKGALILLVICGLLSLLGWLPPEVAAESHIPSFSSLLPLFPCT